MQNNKRKQYVGKNTYTIVFVEAKLLRKCFKFSFHLMQLIFFEIDRNVIYDLSHTIVCIYITFITEVFPTAK